MKLKEKLAYDSQFKWAIGIMNQTGMKHISEPELRDLGKVPYETAYLEGFEKALEMAYLYWSKARENGDDIAPSDLLQLGDEEVPE